VSPEEKPAFFSMITGNVNELFAHSHHFKWWREQKLKQQAWARAHGGPPPGASEAREAASAPSSPENP
jgi:hypothetical protein